MDNLSTLTGKVGYIPSVFCSNGACQTSIPLTGESVMNLRDGIPQNYSQDVATGGLLINRSMLNTIGRLGSRAQFFEQCGGFYTFDSEVSAAIGGYPQGAVLSHYSEGDGIFHKVRSLKANNTFDFTKHGVDGVNWAYCDSAVDSLAPVFPDFAEQEDVTDSIYNGLVDISSLYVPPMFVTDRNGWIWREPMNEFVIPYDCYLSLSSIGYKGISEQNGDGSWSVQSVNSETFVYLSIANAGSNTFSDYAHSPIIEYTSNSMELNYAYQMATNGGILISLSQGDKVKLRKIRCLLGTSIIDDGETFGKKFDYLYYYKQAKLFKRKSI